MASTLPSFGRAISASSIPSASAATASVLNAMPLILACALPVWTFVMPETFPTPRNLTFPVSLRAVSKSMSMSYLPETFLTDTNLTFPENLFPATLAESS